MRLTQLTLPSFLAGSECQDRWLKESSLPSIHGFCQGRKPLSARSDLGESGSLVVRPGSPLADSPASVVRGSRPPALGSPVLRCHRAHCVTP